MGYGAFMSVVNSDKVAHSLNVTYVNNMDNGGDPHQFTRTYAPYSVYAGDNGTGVYLESSGWSTSYITLQVDNTSATIQLQEQDNYSLVTLNGIPGYVGVAIDNNYSSDPNGNQAKITICFLNSSPATWMKDYNTFTNGSFSGRALNRVCLPGSHDAGMSSLYQSTTFSTSSNTQTQQLTIGQQLGAGVRFFDLRPAFWTLADWHANGLLYLGHFSSNTNGQGSLGQDLISALQQVAAFASANPQEVVILNFSHYASQDTTGFGANQMYGGGGAPAGSGLQPNVFTYLGNVMYTNTDSNVNLGNLSPQEG